MKLRLRSVVVLFAVALLCNSLPGQTCSVATVVGTYAQSSQGTIIMTPSGASQPVGIPGVGLSLLSVDWQGNITGTGVMSMGGQIMQSPAGGTLAVNSDCTGTIKWSWGGDGVFTVLDDGDEIRGMMTTYGQAKPVWFGTWERISKQPASVSPQACSTTQIVGKYYYRYNGTVMAGGAGGAVPMPMVSTGIASFNYDGTVHTKGFASFSGTIVPEELSGSSISLNPDCSLTMTATIKDPNGQPSQETEWGIVLDGGNEIWAIVTQVSAGNPIVMGTMKRLSPIPFTETPGESETDSAARMRKYQ